MEYCESGGCSCACCVEKIGMHEVGGLLKQISFVMGISNRNDGNARVKVLFSPTINVP